MTHKLTAVGIVLDYCPNGCFPQTPYIDDVFYAIQVRSQPKHFGDPNFYSYTCDCLLVAAVVASDILHDCWVDIPGTNSKEIDEDKARFIIAQAIHDLCAPEARCLFNPAYMEVHTLLGKPMPEDDSSAANLRMLCGCPEHSHS